MKNRIGIIGGMGNEAMVDLLKKMDSEKNTPVEFIAFGNSRLAYKPEEIAQGWKTDDLPELRKKDTATYTLALLDYLGVNTLGLACNSAHELIRSLVNAFSFSFVDMIQETAKHIKNKEEKVLIFGVTSLVDSKLYHKALNQEGIEATQASDTNQQKIMQAIYDTQFGIKTAKVTSQAIDLLVEVINEEFAKQNTSTIILGCTELPLALTPQIIHQLIKDKRLPKSINVIDASHVLAKALLSFEKKDPSLPCSALQAKGKHTDYFTPVAFSVNSLQEAIKIQEAIFEITLSFLASHDLSLTGSYWHIPTLFFSNSALNIPEKLAPLFIPCYTQDEDLHRILNPIMQDYFKALM